MTDAQLVSVPAHLVIGCAEPLVIRATNDFLAGRGIAPGDYLIGSPVKLVLQVRQ